MCAVRPTGAASTPRASTASKPTATTPTASTTTSAAAPTSLLATPGSAFVGRTAEVGAFVDALRGPAAMVLVGGEAGVGKSRLVRECLASPALSGRVVLAAACPPLPEPFPLGPVVDGVRRLIPPEGPLGLSPLGGALRPVFPELADRLPPAVDVLTDPIATRHRLFRAFAELLECLRVDVLVVEDVHWADTATWEWLLTTYATGHTRIPVVLTYRPADVPAGSLLRRLVTRRPVGMAQLRIDLQPLDVGGTRDLVAAMFATEQVSEQFAEFLHARTDGLPLALEECLHLLRDRRDIVERGGQWTRRVLDELQVPPTVRDSVLERVERQAPETRAVLEAAAVLATPADEPTLTEVPGLDAEAGRRGVAAALTSGLLREAGPGRFVFRHVLASQAVDEAIPVSRRRHLHRKAAERLRRLDPPPVARLARHFREAGEHEAWTEYAEASADLALESGDDRFAVTVLLELLAAGDHPVDRRTRLARKLGEAAHLGTAALGDLAAQVVDALRNALAAGVATPAARGELRLLLGRMLREISEEPEAYAVIEAAVDDLGHRPDLAMRAMLNLAMPLVPDWPAARHLEWLERGTQALPASTSEVDRLSFAVNRASCLLLLGEEAGWQAVAELPREAASPPERLVVARGLLNAAQLAVVWGRYDEVRPRLASALEHLQAADYQRLRATVRVTEAFLDWHTGNWGDLDTVANELATSETSVTLDQLQARQILGLVALARSERDTARRHLTEVTEEYARLGVVDPLAMPAAAALARLHVAEGANDEALAVLAGDVTTIERKGVWWWATDIAPVAVAALIGGGQVDRAADMVGRLDAGLGGRGGPAPAAALTVCRAVVAEARGRVGEAAALFADAGSAWRALPRPYDELLAREGEGRCLVAAGEERRGLARLTETERDLRSLGARWDADRVARLLRHHGVEVARTWRRGPRGYGDQLSPRELEVVGLVARGLTNRQIGETLFLSPRTVGHHLRAATRKLGVSTRTAAAIAASEAGLIAVDRVAGRTVARPQVPLPEPDNQ
ncbi:AAA family ATPase [Actinopolymorpha sp. NPDC004070]|uniref:helix-turn-helix transcriptional regulator n=1 Tax=Actinopolymorpha sp. NPDC004070 TaxID=3154548 RepID=UPI0033AC47FC